MGATATIAAGRRPTEEALYASISMRQFVGIDLGCMSGFRTRRQF
jgi:hypothetical protein